MLGCDSGDGGAFPIPGQLVRSRYDLRVHKRCSAGGQMQVSHLLLEGIILPQRKQSLQVLWGLQETLHLLNSSFPGAKGLNSDKRK